MIPEKKSKKSVRWDLRMALKRSQTRPFLVYFLRSLCKCFCCTQSDQIWRNSTSTAKCLSLWQIFGQLQIVRKSIFHVQLYIKYVSFS